VVVRVCDASWGKYQAGNAEFMSKDMKISLSVVACVNNDNVLEKNLLRSPAIDSGEVDLIIRRGQKSASVAYNQGLASAKTEYVAFVHQDVYLPGPWLGNVAQAVAQLADLDPNWAVLGIYGVRSDGQHVGSVWCSGLKRRLGDYLSRPTSVESVDELAFVVRRDSDCHFDEGLPGFHLYGTDIIQIARSHSKRSYVAYNPVVHNTTGWYELGGYAPAYNYMRRKWHDRLPIHTTILKISRWGLPLIKNRIKDRLLYRGEEKPTPSSFDPREIAKRIGYEGP
jgi:hypothetical protein